MIQWHPGLTCRRRERRIEGHRDGKRVGRGQGGGRGSPECRNYSSSSHTVVAHYSQTLGWPGESDPRMNGWVLRGRNNDGAPFFHTPLASPRHHTRQPAPTPPPSLLAPFFLTAPHTVSLAEACLPRTGGKEQSPRGHMWQSDQLIHPSKESKQCTWTRAGNNIFFRDNCWPSPTFRFISYKNEQKHK